MDPLYSRPHPYPWLKVNQINALMMEHWSTGLFAHPVIHLPIYSHRSFICYDLLRLFVRLLTHSLAPEIQMFNESSSRSFYSKCVLLLSRFGCFAILKKTAVHKLVQMEWNTDQKVDRRDEIRIWVKMRAVPAVWAMMWVAWTAWIVHSGL